MPKIVDLTHPITAGMTTWPDDPDVERLAWATVGSDGYLLGVTRIGDHTGTHIGVGAHLHPDGVTIDRLPVDLLVRPAVVIDTNHDLSSATIIAWEAEHSRVPAGGVVIVRTGRSRYFNDRDRYRGAKNLDHYGVSLEAARLLAENRGVVGLGIDTLGIDPGADDTLATNHYWLQGYRYHLENLAHLDRLPYTGVTLYIAPLPIVGASGAPARVLALV